MNYESVLDVISKVPPAAASEYRDVRWLTDAQVLGVSRDHDGRIELFLRGDEMHPSSKTVDDAIEFRSWHREQAAPLQATRLLFPALGHFDQVAAFISTELLRNNADVDLGGSFAQTEPLIELAIDRLRLSYEAVIGLAGELLFLEAISRQLADGQMQHLVESWLGWQRSSRDFIWGKTGVEIKTTTRNSSSHLVQGVHQVERSDGSDGDTSEDRLYLVSIGLLETDPGDNSFTIPRLVDLILGRLESTSVDEAEKFLFHVSEYGAYSGNGYDHRTMATTPPFITPFATTFFRAYEMSDPAIGVLRRDDIAARHHVDVASVSFRVDLPIVAGLDNPTVGANQVAMKVLGLHN